MVTRWDIGGIPPFGQLTLAREDSVNPRRRWARALAPLFGRLSVGSEPPGCHKTGKDQTKNHPGTCHRAGQASADQAPREEGTVTGSKEHAWLLSGCWWNGHRRSVLPLVSSDAVQNLGEEHLLLLVIELAMI